MPRPKRPRDGNQLAKRRPGRPEEKVWPEPIDASPEEVARALMQGPPKKDWRYLREANGADGSKRDTRKGNT